MPRFIVPIWWEEIHRGEVTIEAESLEEAREIAEEDEYILFLEARQEGHTYVDDKAISVSLDDIKLE